MYVDRSPRNRTRVRHTPARPADGRAVGLAVHLGRGCDARDGGKRRNGAPHVEYKHDFAEDIWDGQLYFTAVIPVAQLVSAPLRLSVYNR